jgi:hypothetical protein
MNTENSVVIININSLDRRHEQVTDQKKPVKHPEVTEPTSSKQKVSSHSTELNNVRDIHVFVDIIYTFW